MKYILACFLTIAAFGSTLAQAQDEVIARVPFDFVVGNKTFHAGKYTLSSSTGVPQGALSVRSEDGTSGGFFIPLTEENNTPTDTAKLVFLHEGDKYYLNKIVGGSETYVLSPASHRTRVADDATVVVSTP